MHKNMTLLELGWLCPALLSLLRGSPQIHSDQNSLLLLKMLNESKCIWSSPPQSAVATTLGPAALLDLSISSPAFEDADAQQRAVDWAMTLVYALISLMGIIGNLLVVVVVRNVPGMITPTNCYLVSLAISDCIVLFSAAPVELSFLHVDSYIFGSIGCKILSFLPFLGINTSSMSITAFTVERFIGICYPLRARYICTVKRAKMIILCIWCSCILYNSPWLYLATLVKEGDDAQCDFRLQRDNWKYKVIFVVDFAAFYLIPLVIYIFIYGKITYTLSRSEMKYSIANEFNFQHRNSQDIRPNFSATMLTSISHSCPDSPSPKTGRNSVSAANFAQRQQSKDSNGRRNSVSTKGKVQVIKMLAVVVLIFAVCWLPYRAMVMYNSFAADFHVQSFNPEWFIYLSKTMIFFNCAINPVLYNLMSARFRQAFRRFLSGEKQFINSYKRDSVCAQTATGILRFRRGQGENVLRMAAQDMEARATLMLRVQKNGTTTCHPLRAAEETGTVPAEANGNAEMGEER